MSRWTEKRIVTCAVHGLLRAGYSVGVNDTEEDVLAPCRSKQRVLDALFKCDEEYLIARKPGARSSWVRLIYGNGSDGATVICDYGVSLEEALKEANALADEMLS